MTKKNRSLTGAEALVKSLDAAGAEIVFGYPGGQALDIFDAIVKARFKFILSRHEQGAAHMADGYARSTGRAGVCIATSGPGATNLITGLATAYMDGVPMVAVTAQVTLSQIGTDAFQEADMTGICRAVTKHSFLVKSADEIPETVAAAFYIATHGKPGPVVIDIPKNVQQEKTCAEYPERVSLRAYHPEHYASARDVNMLAKIINNAKRPVIYAGGGVIASGASGDVIALARKSDIPVATTLMGIGSIDEHDELSLGFAGMHGSAEANYAIAHADVLIALGVRFSDRITGKISTYAKRAKIVHVDIDPASINKNLPVSLGIVADIKDLLTTVNSRIRKSVHKAWREDIAEWKARYAEESKRSEKSPFISPRDVIENIYRATNGSAVIVTDVGQHQMWTAQYFKHSIPRHFLTSGGMGTMGFGIPAAIGAAFARPDHKTIAICGDGGAQMTISELVVAVEHKLPVTFIVVNNGCLGMVRQWQELFFKGNYSASVFSDKDGKYLPDLCKIALAHGVKAYRVTEVSKLPTVLKKALRSRTPTFVDVIVDPRANVYPLLPYGKTLTEAIYR